ncbi:MAG TPA: NAD(P)-binding domain-containing protein [Vicinamibacterales bacterium]|nr:NAD(P)-binding domain-containing protein [Vicinamibacterales bacterium]
MDRIGFIGLGIMGRPMASNLARKGFPLVVFDLNPARLGPLEALGARAAASCAAVADASDIVITMLPNSADVEEVLLGPGDVLARLRSGCAVIDMSTVDPLLTDRVAAAAAGKGIAFVDAPVGRLASHAERGESLFMVGAATGAFARVKPLLEAMGSTIHHCGGPGTGMRTKLVNNYLAIVSCAFNAEALALSQRFGLSLANTLDVVHGTTATNGQLKIAWSGKVLKGDTTPGFTIDLAHKDLTLIVDAARAAGVPMPIGATALNSFAAARTQGEGAKDFSAMADILCDSAHIDRPRLP